MEVIDNISKMRKRSEELRLSGKSIAFVPTMGFFHDGHLELMRVGRCRADILTISIFVNPIQFAPTEDFNAYPRDKEGDLSKAREAGVDILFVPSVEEMYPKEFQTKITIEKITRYLCGISRPDHFNGVAVVVAKLFNITMPHMAIFGQKDFQQLAVIRHMVKDLNMEIEIMEVPIVREPDGLAMSLRNSYLSPEERRSALCLKRSIDMAKDMVKKGKKDAKTIKRAIKRLILSHNFTKIDYINICDPITMEDMETIEGEGLLALAVRVGKTRLIDNSLIKPD